MRTTRRKRKRNLKFLAVTLLFVLALSAVLIAFALKPDETEPTDGGVSQTASSEASTEQTSRDPQTDTSTDLPSSGTSSALPTDTDTDTDTDSDTTTDEPTHNISTVIPPPADGSKKIAFTFDDGPYAPVTTAIVDEFEKYGASCTFFIVGNRVSGENGEAMLYAAQKGHEIAIHGYTHEYYYDKCSNEKYEFEISETHNAIFQKTGINPVLMRPPGGSITKKRITESDYSVILWNVDSNDWRYKSTGKSKQENIEKIVNNVLNKVSAGDIILMHDLYYNTLDAVKILLPILDEAGYEFVTVSELLGEHRAPGIRYYNAY